jgi:hypothetical protein
MQKKYKTSRCSLLHVECVKFVSPLCKLQADLQSAFFLVSIVRQTLLFYSVAYLNPTAVEISPKYQLADLFRLSAAL